MKRGNREHLIAGRIRKYSEQLQDALQLPPDVTEGAVIIRVSGNREVIISNHRKILLYMENQICLCGKKQRVTVCGSGLCIPYYTDEAMRITGRIHSISLESLYE